MRRFRWLTDLGDRRRASAIVFALSGIVGGLSVAAATVWIAILTLVGPVEIEPADSFLESIRSGAELLPAIFIAAIALPFGFLVGVIAVPMLVALTLRWGRLGQTAAHLITLELLAFAATVFVLARFDMTVGPWEVAIFVATLGGAIPALSRWRVVRPPDMPVRSDSER